MSTTKMRHFSDFNGQIFELKGYTQPMDKEEFRRAFPGVKGLPYDGYSYCVMAAPTPEEGVTVQTAKFGTFRGVLPLTRRINYKTRPSLHECNARCMGGKCGGVCECRCGGRNHGTNSSR